MHHELLSWHRTLLLGAYYYGTWPMRTWSNWTALSAGRAPVAVLFYHRVADDRANSWTLSNRDFERQIGWLAGHCDLIPLAEAQRRISGEAAPSRRLGVSITFDDGYSDNCRQAIPLLLEQRIPFTYFLVLENLIRGEPFQADGKAPNTIEQIRGMAAAGVEIGTHTNTHADLGGLRDRRILEREIVDSGRRLEDLIERRVRYFAFPFGHYANLSSAAFEVAREAGYEAVCSAYGGYNLPGDDPFHLQRVHVDPGMLRLRNRVTIDPRMRRTPRFRLPAAGVTACSAQSE